MLSAAFDDRSGIFCRCGAEKPVVRFVSNQTVKEPRSGTRGGVTLDPSCNGSVIRYADGLMLSNFARPQRIDSDDECCAIMQEPSCKPMGLSY